MSAEVPAPSSSGQDIFPTLTSAQIERIAPLGSVRPIEAGDILFEPGATNRPLTVVLEGEIEILSDRDTLVTVHHPGNLSGDVISSLVIQQSFEPGRACQAASSRCPRSECAA
jgi:hypothetical protein